MLQRTQARNVIACLDGLVCHGTLDGSSVPLTGLATLQFEVRVAASGEVLFREQLPSAIVHVSSVDFRAEGHPQVVVCTADGKIRGYSSVEKLSTVLQAKHDEACLDQVPRNDTLPCIPSNFYQVLAFAAFSLAFAVPAVLLLHRNWPVGTNRVISWTLALLLVVS